MYVRLSQVKRGSRTYRYVQLVESFRRDDGTPTNRVVANLGSLDDLAIDNLRTALQASRDGRALPQPKPLITEVERASVHANLRYLDLAVLLRLWHRLGLHDLVAGTVPAADRTADAADIVAALVLQRCVAPGSKLAAERWYPTTALPELQGISPAQFNNSRIHRVLNDLEQAEPTLQSGLASRVKSWKGAFGALFIDATDTWFVGRGPPIAKKGRDKEGLYRRRVGLVLLCSEQGHPLRWETLDGKYHDATALLDMARQVATLAWARQIPVVLDRAVGNAGATETLDGLGIRYVTALPDTEMESSGAPIPWAVIDALQSETSTDAMGRRLTDAGFVPDDRGRWVLDLGVFDKASSAGAGRLSIATAAMDILDALEAAGSSRDAAARTGVSPRTVRLHRPLRSLIPQVRARLRTDEASRLGMADLHALAAGPGDEQEALLDRLIAEPGRHRHSARSRGRATYPARAVLGVRPERVLADRRSDEANLAAVQTLVVDINRRLSHRSNRRADGSALAEVYQRLQSFGLGGAFRPCITGEGHERRVHLDKDDDAWARRRRGDGINVVISHPSLTHDAADLIRLYFSKDAIERDFRIIKSTIELRPVHHRTDAKVRAHVTLCVLALLLLRALDLSLECSAASALESLKQTRLNLIRHGNTSFHTVTRPDPGVLALLKHLDSLDLIDDHEVAAAISPR